MGDTSMTVMRLALPLLYGAVAAGYIIEFAGSRRSCCSWTAPLLLFTVIFHGATVVLSGVRSNSFPLDTVPKGMLVCAALLAVMAFVLERIQRERSYGVFLFPMVCGITAAASFSLDGGTPLPPYMRSYYFVAHASVLFTAYALFLFSFMVSAMYLLQRHLLRAGRVMPLFRRLPSLEVMDHVVRHADALGLCLLCIGMALGILWMNDAGVGIGTMGVKIGLTVLTAAVYLSEHFLRIGRGWEGERACMVSIAGFALVIATLIAGRHGY